VLIIRRSTGTIIPVGGRPGRPPTGMMVPDDLLMMSTQCSKHVEAYNKPIIKQDFMH